jgi:hypothetical protein
VAWVDWLMMWHSYISREVPLVGHTNINIDDFLVHARNDKHTLNSCLVTVNLS